MFRDRTKQRAGAALAIFGLYCQLILQAVAIPAAFAAMHPGGLPEGYISVVICTGDGMRRIIVDADGTPVEESEQDLPARQCGACHLAGCAAMPGPVQPQLAALPHPDTAMRPLPAQSVLRKPVRTSAHTRAPPLAPPALV